MNSFPSSSGDCVAQAGRRTKVASGTQSNDMGGTLVRSIVLIHDLTPRKCFGFKTPSQAVLNKLAIDVKLSFDSNSAFRL